MKIRTDHKWKLLLNGDQLTAKERAEFDYLTDEELMSRDFIRYRGIVYDLGEFLSAPESLKPWQGYSPDSYFSGIVVRYARDMERIQIGTYIE